MQDAQTAGSDSPPAWCHHVSHAGALLARPRHHVAKIRNEVIQRHFVDTMRREGSHARDQRKVVVVIAPVIAYHALHVIAVDSSAIDRPCS